ncbi:translation initiation factor IF-2-like [Colletes gigas]|uniref:translation initiation factor IF-2-like n=1 Tax=Colletes gigas TaxID=935657 RepID=UPI001C9AA5E1|nr:translation initiation factor IF-2-like [Colletes gigas]
MGKTPKKAAPGGDERNLYNRRLLEATTATSKASETNSHKKQREYKSPNRSNLSTQRKRIPADQRKAIKGKLHTPAQFLLNYNKKPIGRPPGSTKDKKLSNKSVESKPENMQPESEEAEVKLDATTENEDEKKVVSTENEEPVEERVDHATFKDTPDSKEPEISTNQEPSVVEEEKPTEPEIPKEPNEPEKHEDSDIVLSFESDDCSPKPQEEKSNDVDSKENNKEECHFEQPESRNETQEKEDVQSESQTDTESYTVDILESTTSELSEVSEATTQNEAHKEKEKEEETNEKDVSFVSYDPSIMLKDVQIKLNDCMKDNSKVFDTNGSDYDSMSQVSKDSSFGKTLRSISGRRSLNRMRYVTLRDEVRYSPNDSLFVNTSSVSLLPSEAEDYKNLRYSTGLSDIVFSSNGSSTERKRKFESDDWSPTKKPKTESDNSLLNTSISILKGLRRPIQVSTSRSDLKFQTNKVDITDEESNASVNEGAAKKWCTIM